MDIWKVLRTLNRSLKVFVIRWSASILVTSNVSPIQFFSPLHRIALCKKYDFYEFMVVGSRFQLFNKSIMAVLSSISDTLLTLVFSSVIVFS